MGMFYLEDTGIYRCGIWKMDEDEDQLRKILGDYEISTPFTNPKKRIEYLSVRALAMMMDIDPASIAYLPSGKPYLKNNDTNISISHTKGYAAIVLSKLDNIGTDIEQKTERILKIRHKFMRPNEEKIISEQAGEALIPILLHWSAKESLFKAIPDEGVDFIKELQITNFTPPAEKGHFNANALRSGTTFQIDYRVENDFVFTACFPLNP